MSTSPAFDLALWVGKPNHVGDAITIDTLGPPFTESFKPVVQAGQPGVTVGASIPAANAANQIIVSSSAAGNPWVLGVNPATSSSVPAPSGLHYLLLSDATPSWQNSSIANVLSLGGAVTVSAPSTMQPSASLTFLPTGAMTTCLDGTDPTLSAINNFDIDCGTF